ncbi:hypothetical protein KIL84_003013 [Mauremys mutica]|uniref:Uncharacterized protein n=1 Tax=Mauremys mutica TaxID=74926 RepID=A0A9D3WVD0_9SAUR|nr:hypothetical protein KIL84_003013 [Mauremys mutica]
MSPSCPNCLNDFILLPTQYDWYHRHLPWQGTELDNLTGLVWSLAPSMTVKTDPGGCLMPKQLQCRCPCCYHPRGQGRVMVGEQVGKLHSAWAIGGSMSMWGEPRTPNALIPSCPEHILLVPTKAAEDPQA